MERIPQTEREVEVYEDHIAENADYDFDDYEDEGLCPECGGEGTEQSDCIDDLCHGGDVPCMHGEYSMIPCSTCGA